MRPKYLLLLMIAGLGACRSQPDSKQLELINKTLVQTRELLVKNNESAVEYMASRVDDIRYPEARFVVRVIDTVQEATKAIIRYMDEQKNQKVPAGKEVFDRLYAYRQRLFDTSLTADLSRFDRADILATKARIPLLKGYDGLAPAVFAVAAENWVDSNFQGAVPGAVSLSRLENEVLLSEQQLLERYGYIVRDSRRHDDGWPQPLIQLSSNCIYQGDSVEITAGIALFYYQLRPGLIVDGKEIKSDGNPLQHRLRITGRPGRHMMSLRMSYQKPDGSVGWVDRRLEYTILPR